MCKETFGDGIIVGTEVCDDKNFNNADGCTTASQLETYYQCSYNVDRSKCGDICGDGKNKDPNNNTYCDDGAKVNGDGCSSTCTVETGWTCTEDA